MYAIVEIAGQQFKVSKDLKVYVNRLANVEGSKVSFDKVLLLDDNGNITLGAPAIEGASVEAKVLSHLKGDKVIVFKKKRRKGYKKRNGHRQYLTQIIIEGISASGGKKPAKAEAAPAPKAVTTSEEVDAPKKVKSPKAQSSAVEKTKLKTEVATKEVDAPKKAKVVKSDSTESKQANKAVKEAAPKKVAPKTKKEDTK